MFNPGAERRAGRRTLVYCDIVSFTWFSVV